MSKNLFEINITMYDYRNNTWIQTELWHKNFSIYVTINFIDWKWNFQKDALRTLAVIHDLDFNTLHSKKSFHDLYAKDDGK